MSDMELCPVCKEPAIENSPELWKHESEDGWWNYEKWYCKHCHLFWSSDEFYIKPSGNGFAIGHKKD